MPGSFDEEQEALFRAYSEERYDDALAIARRVRREYPRRAARAGFWIACVQCRLRRPDDALSTLRAELDAGRWLNPERLRSDPDLEPIRERPELEAVITESDRLRQQAQREVRPELRVLPATSGGRWGEPPPLLLVLHMRGSDADTALERWSPAARDGALLACAQGTVLDGPREFAWGVGAEAELAAHLRSLEREHAFDACRVVLAGASQGAGVAVGLAVRQLPVPCRGFIALAGVPPREAATPGFAFAAAAAAAAGVRGVFITGEDDFARERVHETFAMLRDHAMRVRFELVPTLGHAYPTDFAERLDRALSFLLG